MRICVIQCKPALGDLRSNLTFMKTEITAAIQGDIDILLFPELMTTGVAPGRFLKKEMFWDEHERLIQQLQQFINRLDHDITVIFGGIHKIHAEFTMATNSVFVLRKLQPQRILHKRILSRFNVFDESNYFVPGFGKSIPITIENNAHSLEIDILFGEDIRNYKYQNGGRTDPVTDLVGEGPIFVLDAAPFWLGRIEQTKEIIEKIVGETGRPLVYVNQIGGHNEFVMHGGSIVTIPPTTMDRRVYTRFAKFFAEDKMIIDFGRHYQLYADKEPGKTGPLGLTMPTWFEKTIEPIDFNYWCMFQGIRIHLSDYCRRTGFTEVLIDLSGRLNSSLVAVLASEALGCQHVNGMTLPSKYSSESSWQNAESLANELHLGTFENISIQELHKIIRNTLLSGGKQEFENRVTDENIQARCRMILLMARSNEYKWLLLAGSNKSEITVGHGTLYGDLAGGLALLKDVSKTEVQNLAESINHYKRMIPDTILKKEPSAELAEKQKDSDILPPYEDLDPLLEDLTLGLASDIVRMRTKIPERVVEIESKIENARHKARQLPLGSKLHEAAFQE